MPTTSRSGKQALRFSRRRMCPQCGNHAPRVRSGRAIRILRILTFGLLRTRRCGDCKWRGPSIG